MKALRFIFSETIDILRNLYKKKEEKEEDFIQIHSNLLILYYGFNVLYKTMIFTSIYIQFSSMLYNVLFLYKCNYIERKKER